MPEEPITTLLVGIALAVAANNMEPTMNFMIAIITVATRRLGKIEKRQVPFNGNELKELVRAKLFYSWVKSKGS